MDHKDFDDILRDKLGELSGVNRLQPDWDRMEREIAEDSLRDQAFDTQIKRKLADLKVGHYTPSNWSRLFELIDRRIKNKQAVLVSKAVELSLAVLLLVTCVNLGYYYNADAPSSTDKSVKVQIAMQDVESSTQNEVTASQTIESDEISNLIIDTQDNTSVSTVSVHETNDLERIIEVSSNEESLFLQSNDHKSSNSEIAPASDINDSYANLEKLETATMSNNNIDVQLIDQSDAELIQEIQRVAFQQKHAEVTFEAIPSREMSMLPMKSFALNHSEIQAVKPKTWFASLQGGYQFNNIDSDVYHTIVSSRNSTENKNETTSNRMSMNAAFEAELGKSLGTVDLSIGAGYQTVAYNPSLNLTTGNITSRYVETSLESISYSLLSIPVRLRWNALKWKSWSAGIQGSLVNTFLLKSEQRISQKLIQGDRIQFVAQSEIDYKALDYDFATGINDEVEATPNALFSNFFLRGTLGGQISKQITPKMSLFGTYNYLFNLPIKADKFEQFDKIETQYFGIGVRRYIG